MHQNVLKRLVNLSSLKPEIDKLDIDELKAVAIGLKKLSELERKKCC